MTALAPEKVSAAVDTWREQDREHKLLIGHQPIPIVVFNAKIAGSRVRNYHTRDSDIDLRVLYHRPVPSYFSVFKVDSPVDSAHVENVDVSGWDIHRFLSLLWSNDLSAMEYAFAPPIDGLQDHGQALAKLASQCVDAQKLFMGYFGNAQGRLWELKHKNRVEDTIQSSVSRIPENENSKAVKALLQSAHSLLSAIVVWRTLNMPPIDSSILIRFVQKVDSTSTYAQSFGELIAARRRGDSLSIKKAAIALAQDLPTLADRVSDLKDEMSEYGFSESQKKAAGRACDDFLHTVLNLK